MSKKTIAGLASLVVVLGLCLFLYLWRDQSYVPSWSEHRETLDSLDQKLKALLAQIEHAHGEGKCSADSQCRVVGMGVKSCGGYSDYLIYSTLDAEESTLLTLVARFNETSEAFNKVSLHSAPCGEQAKPIGCHNEECVPQ